MLYENDDESGQTPAEPSSASPSENSASLENSQQSTSSPPIFHPLAYRGVVANWPIDWREQWGRRANSLEETGLSWRDAETQAFVEVWNQLRGHSAEQPSASTTPVSAPEQN
jgi:hypothetical protein